MDIVLGLVYLFVALNLINLYVDFKLNKLHKKLDSIEQRCDAISKSVAYQSKINKTG